MPERTCSTSVAENGPVRYAVVTPVRDEERFIAATIELPHPPMPAESAYPSACGQQQDQA